MIFHRIFRPPKICFEVLLFFQGHVWNSNSNYYTKESIMSRQKLVLGNNTAQKNCKKMTKTLNKVNKSSMSVTINAEQKRLICLLMMAINLPD